MTPGRTTQGKPLHRRAIDWSRWRMFFLLRAVGHRWSRLLGIMAECRIRLGYWPNMVRPRRFTEHMAVRRAFRRFDQRHVITADKYAVREWVADRVGPEVLNRIHQVVDCVDDLDLSALPDACVVKATHVQGGNYLIPDKSRLDATALREFCRQQLSRRFGVETFEDHYLSIPPRLIVEDWLGTADGDVPNDYKFHVFHGVPAFALAGCGRFGEQRFTYMDTDWNRLAVVNGMYPEQADFPRPPALAEMLRVAAILGKDFDFCRIDLYDIDGRVVFGEMTHIPSAGYLRFRPEQFDAVAGRLLMGEPRSILEGWRAAD